MNAKPCGTSPTGVTLTDPRAVAFVGPSFFYSLIIGPTASVVPTLYSSRFGIEAFAVSAILIASRVLDALLDPLVGFLSDRTRSRLGRRKPWLVAGSALVGVSVYALFVPPNDAGIWYFSAALAAVYLTWTLIEIPHTAWIAELTTGYHQRSRIISFKSGMMYAGTLAFMITPLLPIFGSTAITFEVLGFLGKTMIFAVPLLVLLAVTLVPKESAHSALKNPGLLESLSVIKANAPFRLFAVGYFIFQVSVGFIQTTFFLYFSSYLGIGDKAPYIFGAALSASLLSIPLWLRLSYRIGKKATWITGIVGTAVTLPAIALLTPGPDSFWPYFALDVVTTVFYTAGAVISNAVVPDLIDYDAWKYRVNRTGQFAAMQHLLIKAGRASGAAAAFLLLGLAGYEAYQQQHSAFAILGLKFTTAVAPALLMLAALPFIAALPITENRQKALRRRLDMRLRTAPTGGLA